MTTSDPDPAAPPYRQQSPGVTPELSASLQQFADTVTARWADGFRELALKHQRATEERLAKITAPLQLPKLSEGITAHVAKASEPLRALVASVVPSNWPRGMLTRLDEVDAILEDEGIPLVHVPRAAIVTELLDAATPKDRLAVVTDRCDDIAADCDAVLAAGSYSTELDGQLPLARSAVAAFLAGHHESAQALAVNVCDTYLKTHMKGVGAGKRTTYDDIAQAVSIDKNATGPVGTWLNVLYALAPVARFLTQWNPDSANPGPAPVTFSRHASIHGASADVYNKTNATVAIMLVTSLTVALDIAVTRAKPGTP